VNKHLIEASQRTGAKLVATCDSHYACPEHWREREIYKAMAWSSKTKGEFDIKSIPEKLEQQHYQLYPKNADQMWDSFEVYCRKTYPDLYSDSDIEKIRDAIELTHDIAHNQIGEIKFDTSIKYPTVSKLVDQPRLEAIHEKFGDLSEDDIVMKELVHRCIQGLKFRKKANDQPYIDRCKEELGVIKHLNLQKYFLTYAKILEVVSKQMTTGPGRGSACGSLVLYVLNITQVDPLKYGLLFERFLTRFKKGAADIDLDYSDREKALELISDHFGHEAVLPVTNFNQLKLKSLIKDLARMYALPYDEINQKTYLIEKEARAEARKNEDFDAGVWELTYDEATKFSPTFRELVAQYPDLDSSLKVLYRQVRGLSTHASGVGIYTGNPEELPIIKFGKLFQTPWPEGQNYRHLEAFGVLKYDVLGLGTLRMHERCIEKILQKQTGRQKIHFYEIKDWYYKNIHPDNNTLDDQDVYKKIFWESKEVGVFQWVADNVKAFTASLKPTKIEDLSAITATFRPGPMKAGVDKLLLNNRKSMNDAIESLPHPSLAPILKDTDYVLIYQEQVQKIFHVLAGIPLDQTDDVRKAFTKRDLSNLEKTKKERQRLKEEFVKNCGEHSKLSPKDAANIFDYMEKYVAYSFNLSHSISYAIVAYQCAWLQHYFPDQWITTYIDYCATDKGRVTGKEDPKAIAIKEAKMLGYSLGKPDINYSEESFIVNTVLDGLKFRQVLVPSFSSLKFVGKTVLQEIRKYRPYKEAQDLLLHPGSTNNWRHTKFSKRALATLIQLEALDSMRIVGPDKQFKNYRQLYLVLVDQYDKLKAIGKRKKNNDVVAAMQEMIATVQNERDWTLSEKLELSKELAGSVDMNLVLPQEKKDYLQKSGFNDIDSLFPATDDEMPVTESASGNSDLSARCYCVVTSATIAYTKKANKPYLKLKLLGESAKERMCFVWNWNPKKTTRIKENDVLIGLFKKTDFGLSAFESKIRIVVDQTTEPLPIAND
jgi:DNA polymerase-3 subunit alpha